MSRDVEPWWRGVEARAATAAGVEHITPWIKPRGGSDPAHGIDFFVGFHQPRALEYSPVPLFVALPRLLRYACDEESMPKACVPWALDSGGFTELSRHGGWRMHPDVFGGAVTRIVDECGAPPAFCAPQDWMCEPWVVMGGTHEGRTYPGTGWQHLGFEEAVRIHQELTVENYLYLRREFYFINWMPVLQGWTLDHYLRCCVMYAEAGVDLTREHRVGLGSVCRRQATGEIGAIVSTLAGMGLRLHGFGVKREGLRQYAHHLASADSMAWSAVARRQHLRLPGCTHRAALCNNCLTWATAWRELVLSDLRSPRQDGLALALTGIGRQRPTRGRPSRPAPGPTVGEQLGLAL